jgi:hypothetical protein
MRLTEAVRSALSAIAANALRSLLTMLGIVIGVAAVIAMVAIGSGARNLVDRQIRSLGANLAIVTPGNVTQGGARLGAGAASTLTDEDASAIKREVDGVAAAAPFIRGTAQAVFAANNWSTSVYGVDLDYFVAREWEVETGRGLDPEEIRRGEIVALIGKTVARNLFGEGDPLDQIIRVRNVPFKVVGVMASKGQSAFGQDQDDVIFVPLDAGRRRVIGRNQAKERSVSSIFVKFDNEDEIAPGIQRIEALLRQRHRIGPDQEADFSTRNLTEIANTASAFHAARGGRGRVAAGRRHRHHEHHAGVGHRANARDRPSSRRRRAPTRHSRPVPDRGDDARHHRRRDRHRARRRSSHRHRQSGRLALAHRARGGRRRGRVLGDGWHFFWVLSGPAGRQARSHRGAAAGVGCRAAHPKSPTRQPWPTRPLAR